MCCTYPALLCALLSLRPCLPAPLPPLSTTLGFVRNEFESLGLEVSIGSVASASLNSVSAAVRKSVTQLSPQLAAAASMLQSKAAVQGSISIDGLAVVPRTINVHLTSVGGFIGLCAGFAVGSSIVVLLLTVLLVRLRRT